LRSFSRAFFAANIASVNYPLASKNWLLSQSQSNLHFPHTRISRISRIGRINRIRFSVISFKVKLERIEVNILRLGVRFRFRFRIAAPPADGRSVDRIRDGWSFRMIMILASISLTIYARLFQAKHGVFVRMTKKPFYKTFL
jgi:hypothetical protein